MISSSVGSYAPGPPADDLVSTEHRIPYVEACHEFSRWWLDTRRPYRLYPPADEVPDTLDLAERAALALNGLAGILDPQANYEFWWYVNYARCPPVMRKDSRSFSACGPKLLESFPMMRLMSCSTRFEMEEQRLLTTV